MDDVLIVVPVLGRPHRVKPLLASIEEATTVPHRVLFVCSTHDHPMRDAVEDAHAEHLVIDWQPFGDYARKINTAYQQTTEPLLFTAADDLRFHPFWFEAAVRRISDRVGVVGTNDLGSARVKAGLHATHFLISRAYIDAHGTIDEPGKVFHEGYPHEYVDDELVGTAQHRGAWAFARSSKVEHLHPDYGKAPSDDLYAAQGTRMKQGRRLYKMRRQMWT